MKKLCKKLYICIAIITLICLFFMQFILASSTVPFEYNIIPLETNKSIIDTKTQKKLGFKLYEPIDQLFYNDELVKIENNNFFY